MKRESILVLAAICAACGGSAGNGGSSDAGDAGKRDAAGPHADAGNVEAGHGNDAAPDAPASACAMASTKLGPVLGARSGSTCAYEGIPFAAPPTGLLRWSAPAPAKPWTAPRPSAPASACPQATSPLGAFGTASSNEDCLYLNVWSPVPAPKSGTPVMVFVHGGSYIYGSGTFSLYDGAKLAAETGNLVVTLNYRLGPFGFLSNPALRAEDKEHHSTGNYALLDQLAAFHWVHDNIAAFGGDPSNVTIFGESAGGTSMFVHLASPLTKGLFSRMMIESGWAPDEYASQSPKQSDAYGATFASALGCSGASLLTCLRGKSTSDVLDAVPSYNAGTTASNGVYWFPVVDGYIIPKDPVQSIIAGSFTKVPLLIGNNADEGTLFLFSAPPTDEASFQALEEAEYPGEGAAIVAKYPASAYSGSYFLAAAQALTDSQFLCPARRVARAVTAGGAPVYRYDFTHALSVIVPNLGAFHGSELVFVFGNPIPSIASLSPSEAPLSHTMMDYWGAMAKSGDPNGGARFAWPKYAMATEPEIDLDLEQSAIEQLEKSQCDFWDSIAP